MSDVEKIQFSLYVLLIDTLKIQIQAKLAGWPQSDRSSLSWPRSSQANTNTILPFCIFLKIFQRLPKYEFHFDKIRIQAKLASWPESERLSLSWVRSGTRLNYESSTISKHQQRNTDICAEVCLTPFQFLIISYCVQKRNGPVYLCISDYQSL